MNYVNDNFEKIINSNLEMRHTLNVIENQVDTFMENFNDSPEKISRWGHYYFCDVDGGRLIFDINKPTTHKCEICGQEFKSEILDGVWTYFYRNEAIINSLLAAFCFKATKEKKYLEYTKKIIGFYAENYTKFKLHKKENNEYNSYEEMEWGCGRIMPQGLNESILGIRIAQAFEIVKDYVDDDFKNLVISMFKEMYLLLKPQVVAIHNISCWDAAAIGVMGLSGEIDEMVNFAFNSEFGIKNQLNKGVTKDCFWYEGSTHYNFFLLEGVSYLFLFSKIKNYDFGKESTEILLNMYEQAYKYAFDNGYLPNPNDGWPNLHLKTFSYQYHIIARVMGENSIYGDMVKNIVTTDVVRPTLPLSEPYYCENKYCLEELLFNLDFDYSTKKEISRKSECYPYSNFAVLRDDKINAFIKFGLNGSSHAHPDIMNVEIMYGDYVLSRDLSNAGYRARLCNEWHRKTLAHNTVVCNGLDMTKVEPGEVIEFNDNFIKVYSKNVYDNVDYTRSLKVLDNTITDKFVVNSKEKGVFDYIFHIESEFELSGEYKLQDADLNYKNNGYQHILETKKVLCESDVFKIKVIQKSLSAEFQIDVKGKELFLLKTMDNPVNHTRNSFLIRESGKDIEYNVVMKFMEENK